MWYHGPGVGSHPGVFAEKSQVIKGIPIRIYDRYIYLKVHIGNCDKMKTYQIHRRVIEVFCIEAEDLEEALKKVGCEEPDDSYGYNILSSKTRVFQE